MPKVISIKYPKIKKFKIRDSSDVYEALKEIIEDTLNTKKPQSQKDVAVFTALVNTFQKLETNMAVPKKIKELEDLIDKQKKK